MFSLGIWALLDDLASTLGPERLILAYLDDIYILSNNPNALDDVQAFFATRPTFYPTQYGKEQDHGTSGGKGTRHAAPQQRQRTHSW
jgi:hypothetical protein